VLQTIQVITELIIIRKKEMAGMSEDRKVGSKGRNIRKSERNK
jgi:hypothetical protein